MRIIPFEQVADAVEMLCSRACCELPADVMNALRQGRERETSESGRDFFDQYLENAEIARTERLPLCQDTGFAVFFAELGEDARVDGGIYEAINAGVERGYRKYFLRKSIVDDPLFDRKNTGNNTPAIIHLKLVRGDQLKLVLAPKGGGSENMSAVKMLKPADGRDGVVNFIVESVRNAGGNPCPPTVLGIGIGGTMEMAAYLAKHALLREIGSKNPDPRYAELEAEILEKVNALNVGPQGLGGKVTSFAVHIEHHPCHLASLPVALNMNCHAARHAEVTL